MAKFDSPVVGTFISVFLFSFISSAVSTHTNDEGVSHVRSNLCVFIVSNDSRRWFRWRSIPARNIGKRSANAACSSIFIAFSCFLWEIQNRLSRRSNVSGRIHATCQIHHKPTRSEKPERNEMYFYPPTKCSAQSHQSHCHWYWTSFRFSGIRWTHCIGGFVCVVECIDALSITSQRLWTVFSFPNSIRIAFLFKEQPRGSAWTRKIYLEKDFLTWESRVKPVVVFQMRTQSGGRCSYAHTKCSNK